MKKLMLLVAAMLLSTIGFAQVAGAPTAGTADKLAGAAADANKGLSVQNGDDNKVRVRQAGTFQSVLTYQDNGDGDGGNLAKVMQTGEVQAGSGVANKAEVNQSGTTNQSTTVQEGDTNDAITNQGQNEPTSTDNRAMIRQGIGQQAQDNYAAIEQDGDRNMASTRQIYDNSDAWTRQIGNDNGNMIIQDAGPNQTDGHEAMAYQEGDGNESAIEQSGAGGRNDAQAIQIGDDNQSKQWQTTNAASGMDGNSASVFQGWGFRDLFNPSSSYDLADELNSVIVLPGGFDPLPDQGVGSGVLSFGARAKQIQYGKLNDAEIFQNGGSGSGTNYAEQVQASGWDNDAALAQYQVGSGDNYAKQYQAGDRNDAYGWQSGNSHKSLQDQRGHRNVAIGSQTGSGNLLNQHQRGNDNRASSLQHGAANRALIVQHDGQSYTSLQNESLGWLDTSAGGNQVDVLQVGPDGNFGIDYAIECDFEPPMNLDMDYEVPDMQIGDICPDC